MSKTKETKLKFSNPPVSEVVCGVEFDAISGLKVPHVGLYWDKIREEYPLVEQVQPISSDTKPDSGFMEWVTEMPMPRIWFSSMDETRLVQFQPDRFLFNWKESDGSNESGDGQYPSYEAVFSSFSKEFSTFEDFVGEVLGSDVSIRRAEITYVNHIFKSDGWDDFSQLGQIFKVLDWKGKGEIQSPDALSLTFLFNYPKENMNLRIKIQSAAKVTDPETQILRLELVAKSNDRFESSKDMSDWFDKAHQKIINAFVGTTSDNMQKGVWGKD